MPQMRIYHQGRYMYYRPGRMVHFLPPLQPTPFDPPGTRTSVVMETSSNDDLEGNRRRHRRAVQYRKLIDHVSNSLTRENIDDMKFLAKEHIYPSHLLDRVSNGRAFIALLEHHRLLAENSLHFLQTLLYYIARSDLYERVFRFRFDIQGNFRKNGVVIEDKYNLREQPKELLQLPVEVKSFRDDLNPRSRFKNVNIPTMQERLNKLSTKLDDTRRWSTTKAHLHGTGTVGDAYRDRLRSRKNSAIDLIICSEAEKLESLPEPGPRRIHIPSGNLMTQSPSTSTSGVNAQSCEPLSANLTTEDGVDVKMKKLRRRLNVNLSKRREEGSSIIKHQYRRSKKHTKKTPFIRKTGENKGGTLPTDGVTDLMIKRVTPLTE